MKINEIAKEEGSWCPKFAKGVGCSIHDHKPDECRRFQCYWSISELLGDEWRPDRAKFVLWSDADGRIIVEVDAAAPYAWRREPYLAALRSWTDPRRPRPLQVLVRVAGRMMMLFPDAEVDIGPHQPGRNIRSGYEMQDGKPTPYARYMGPDE